MKNTFDLLKSIEIPGNQVDPVITLCILAAIFAKKLYFPKIDVG